MSAAPLVIEIRQTTHRDHDDLLSAGLGLEGLQASPPPFADALAPTSGELRRRAIHTNWRGIADLGPLGGYGNVYGAVPKVPGREYQAFARVAGAQSPHRVLVQIPDSFDAKTRCLLVTASSGSRGVYGAIALAGAWGLPRGCAVAYTDKGTGAGYYDFDSHSGVALDGRRTERGAAMLEFEPADAGASGGIAVKHAHSGDHPEADWGRHVLQAAQFGLAMLDRAYPQQAPFTPQNTRVIAVGVSNGAGAALQAAGIDTDHLLAGVVALAPNVHMAGHGRALYDYVTEAALYLPCALADARFATTPFARSGGAVTPASLASCAQLHRSGAISGTDLAAQARAALDHLHANGWDDRAIATAASTTAFDLWRVLGATYASAYLRARAGAMPCDFRFGAVDASGVSIPADAATRAAWWADANGIPPGAGVHLLGGGSSVEARAAALEELRALWTGDSAQARTLRASVDATQARIPREDLPIILVHGEDDGLLPIAFSSDPCVAALEAAGRTPTYWRVPHAQHFDAFLALPQFGDRHVPLLPYGYAALDRMLAHLAQGVALPPSRRIDSRPRGAGALDRSMLGL